MTNDKNYADLFTITLSEENPPEQRLQALSALYDVLLKDEDFAKLLEIAREEKSSKVKGEIATLLIQKATPFIKEGDTYFQYASQLSLFESEPSLRVLGIRMICDLISIRPEAESILAEVFRYELEDSVLRAALYVSLDLPVLGELVREALRYLAARIPDDLNQPFFILVDRLPLDDQAACVGEVLTPFASAEIKLRAIELIGNLSQLPNNIFERICQILELEAIPEIWSKFFTLLFRFKDLSPAQQIRAFETLERRMEENTLAAHFSSFFDSNPGIISHLKGAFEKSEATPILCFLKITEKTGSPDFALQALVSPHKDVRAAGLKQLIKLLPSYPEKIVSVLISQLQGESDRNLRVQIIKGLEGNALLYKATFLTSLADQFLREKDFECKKVLAGILLVSATDSETEEILKQCWTQFLSEPLFDQRLKGAALRKLLETSVNASPELQMAYGKLVDEIDDFETFKDVFNQGKLLFQDLKSVFPHLLIAFYRFAEFYPAEPLREIVQFIKKRYQELTSIHGEIGRVAEITGDSDLLGLASAEDQKNILYPEIQAAIRSEDVSKIRELIRSGYEKRILRKSEILKLYNDSLHHPCLSQILKPTIDVLCEVKLHSKEMVDAALNFLRQYSFRNDSGHEVLRYLREIIKIEPGYAKQLLESLSDQEYLVRIKAYSDFSRKYELGRQFNDNTHWREDYSSDWHILSLLEDVDVDAMPRLRESVQQLILSDQPSHWNIGHLYLKKLSEKLHKNTDEDIANTAALFRKARVQSHDSYLIDRAATVFYYQWMEIVRKKKMDLYTDEMAKVASEVLNHFILQWYSKKSYQEYYWINAVEGVDLDYLFENWQGPKGLLEKFFQLAEDALKGKTPQYDGDRPEGSTFPEVSWREAVRYIAQLFFTAKFPVSPEIQKRVKPIFVLLSQQSGLKVSSFVWGKNVTDVHLSSIAEFIKE